MKTTEGRDTKELWKEFDAAWERGIETRCKYSFIKTHKPVIDDAPFRAWKTTADYRRWCDENVPSWLGYGNPLVSHIFRTTPATIGSQRGPVATAS